MLEGLENSKHKEEKKMKKYQKANTNWSKSPVIKPKRRQIDNHSNTHWHMCKHNFYSADVQRDICECKAFDKQALILMANIKKLLEYS